MEKKACPTLDFGTGKWKKEDIISSLNRTGLYHQLKATLLPY